MASPGGTWLPSASPAAPSRRQAARSEVAEYSDLQQKRREEALQRQRSARTAKASILRNKLAQAPIDDVAVEDGEVGPQATQHAACVTARALADRSVTLVAGAARKRGSSLAQWRR